MQTIYKLRMNELNFLKLSIMSMSKIIFFFVNKIPET